jgi:Lrp/AsnC family transcriptional regulator for asnA, asnC and gidA
MAIQKIDKLDRQMLRLVSEDARIPFLEVARVCNVSGAAIHQRVQKLYNLGVLRGSQFMIDPEKIGYETCAYIGLNLKNPESFDAVVEELKKIPEVVECHFTTGPYTMLVKLYARDNEQLMHLLNGQLQEIPGVVATETLISLEQNIKREIPVNFDDKELE